VNDNISINIINFVQLWTGHLTIQEKGADPYAKWHYMLVQLSFLLRGVILSENQFTTVCYL